MDDILATQITQLKKAHLRLMRHPETCLYSGIILMGKSEVEDKEYNAYTDGKNKRYSMQFLATLTLEEVTGLVLHETASAPQPLRRRGSQRSHGRRARTRGR